MKSHLIRSFLVLIFLVALEVWLTFWSQVGGQYHLDLMFWPWKFGLSLAAALLTTGIAAELFRGTSKRVVTYTIMLFLVMVVAGVVTYYYHLNEPADDDENSDSAPTQTYLWRPAFPTRPDRL